MIIVKDVENYNVDLQRILSLAVVDIQSRSSIEPKLLKLSGTAFEEIVCDTLNKVSEGSVFHKIFEQATAHAFPDIFAKMFENKWFGIEVKTSQGDWKCFGNSIFESSKPLAIEDRIYVFFGRFSSSSLECRWAKYDTCIDNINITHSPRYQINMDIKDDSSLSVFSKMDTTYLKFSTCSSTERMDFVRKFKRQNLGQNIALWWLPDHEGPTIEDEKKLIVRLFSDLSLERKTEIRNVAMALFPEIFSKKNKKYSRLLPWLASQYGVVTGNVRDNFSAGGKEEIQHKGIKYLLPQVCYQIYIGRKEIKSIIINSSVDDLTNQWKLPKNQNLNSPQAKISCWIDLVSLNLTEIIPLKSKFPIEDWLTSLF